MVPLMHMHVHVHVTRVVSALGSHRCVRVYDPLPARPMRLLAPAQAAFNSSVRHNHKTKI